MKKLVFIKLKNQHNSFETKFLEEILIQKALADEFIFLPEGWHTLQELANKESHRIDMLNNSFMDGKFHISYKSIYQFESIHLWWLGGQAMKFMWEYRKQNKNHDLIKEYYVYLFKGYLTFFKDLPSSLQIRKEEYFQKLEKFAQNPLSAEGMEFKNWLTLIERNEFFFNKVNHYDFENQLIVSLWGSAHFDPQLCTPLNKKFEDSGNFEIITLEFGEREDIEKIIKLIEAFVQDKKVSFTL